MLFHGKIQRALRLLEERSAQARKGAGQGVSAEFSDALESSENMGVSGGERAKNAAQPSLPELEKGDLSALILAGFLVLSPVFLLLLLLIYWLL